jgi:peptide/nickel transport system permease protein
VAVEDASVVAAVNDAEVVSPLAVPLASGRRPGRRRRRKWGLWLAIGWLSLTIITAIFAFAISPYGPDAQNLTHALKGPSWAHWLGTDNYGRDVLSRVIWGGQAAWEGVVISMVVALVLGVPWGIVSGYWPRYIGTTLMRVADALLAFPALIFAIVVTGILGPSLVNSMVVVGVVFSPVIARLMRVGVLSLRDRSFVESSRLSGCPTRVVLWRHIFPQAIGPVIVQATIFAGLAFIIEGALSFLGFSIQPPEPSWGGDMAQAFEYVLSSPGEILPYGIVIAITVLSIYRVGDSLRDHFGAALASDSSEVEQATILA